MLTLEDSPQEAEFRREIRAWAHAHLPAELCWREDHEALIAVDRILSDAGLLAPGWPARYGGRGLPAGLVSVLTSELESLGVQRAKSPSHQGINNFGPTLIKHGTSEQKQRYLPQILAVSELWCQGFSETEAGSDLASVRSTARADGADFVVNGAKVWTSGASQADWIYLLVRTGSRAERHRGLSFLVAPMTSAGIAVQPIEQIVGGSDFCQVVLDDVRVPRANLIGSEGQGWAVAMTLLSAERLSGRHRYGSFRRELDLLARLLADAAGGDWHAISSDGLRDLGRLVADIEGMGALARRAESRHAAGADPGVLPSASKLWWPAAHQRLAEAGLFHSAGAGADTSYWYRLWLAARPESIYGGAAQVQRNIIAERFLDLPR